MGVSRFGVVMMVAASLLTAAACNRQPAQDSAAPAPTAAQQPVNDASLETTVQARLYADDALRGEDIDVTANNGQVTLRGTVRSAAAQQQALTVARGADGVTTVVDEITVAPSTTASTATRSPRQRASRATQDPTTAGAAWITTKIQAQYFVNPHVKPWNVDVTTTSGGVVELRGEVESAEAKADAVRIAQNTDGVSRVDDMLRVRHDTAATSGVNSGLTDSDAWLTAKIQAKYFLDADVRPLDLDVKTENGIVTLTGTVDSASDRRDAVAIARNTSGVRDVRDQLRLSADAASARPRARGTTGNGIVEGVEDSWITTKIQSKYFLEPDVKGHQINVDTRRGVVTLNGSVESGASKQLAEQIARDTDGVTRVVNRLKVSLQP